MKITLVIPTYWTSSKYVTQSRGVAPVYDHPTPLNSPSSLPRLLRSLKTSDLPRKSTSIIAIAAVVHPELEKKATSRVQKIVSEYKPVFDIRSFSSQTLNGLISADERLENLLSLYGYSNIRNLGLVVAQILNSDIVVFMDDDIVVEDRTYFRKVMQYIGEKFRGKRLSGVAGYYTNKSGSYILDTDPTQWWKAFWPKTRKMNEAFEIIKSRSRLVETTFALGGNMALHWRMFEKIPFDPYITRGEDMDLLLNAKIFGFELMLDTELGVIHLTSEKQRFWSEMRQDLYRFLYMREKILSHKNGETENPVALQTLNPYPGYFLESKIVLRFTASSVLSCFHSLTLRETRDAKEFLYNLTHISKALQWAKEHSLDYFAFQEQWSRILPDIRNNQELRSNLDMQM